MSELNLTKKELNELIEAHRQCREKKNAYKINAVLLLAKGWTYPQIEEALLLDERTVRRYKDIYIEQGIDGLFVDNYKGSQGYLSKEQKKELTAHLEEHIYLKSSEIVDYIKKKFQVVYTPEGLVPLLHKLGFGYKKAKHIPGKCDLQKQRNFLRKYKRIRKNMGENDSLYFTDAVHPTFNSIPSYGWIKKGTEKFIRSNTGRERVNINGAINPVTQDIIVSNYDTIDKKAMVDLLKRIKEKNPKAEKIYVIMDNAPYNHALDVRFFAKINGIKIIYLPSYSPNLNLIERLWHIMKRETLYNHYYDTFDKFKNALMNFLNRKGKRFKARIESGITEKFHLFDAA